MSEKPRRPQTFKLDDPGVIVIDPDGSLQTRGFTVSQTP